MPKPWRGTASRVRQVASDMLPRGSSVLVTGGTGFLGRAFLQRIAGRHEIFALARNPGVAPIIAGVEWIEGDLRRPLAQRPPAAPRRRRRASGIGARAVGRGRPRGAVHRERRRNRSARGLRRQAGARRFVYGSTGGVYGYRAGRIRETNTPAPFDLYTREQMARRDGRHTRAPALDRCLAILLPVRPRTARGDRSATGRARSTKAGRSHCIGRAVCRTSTPSSWTMPRN